MNIKNIILLDKYRSMVSLPEWLREWRGVSEQIKSLRQLLGMTQSQLGKRSGGDGRYVRRLESSLGDPQLSTLGKIAKGLECELLVCFVPKRSLKKVLKERAIKKAEKLIAMSTATAAMEKQQPKKKYIRQQIQEMVRMLLEKKRSSLWDD